MAKMLGNDASIFLDAFDLSLGGREAVISARADVLEATDLSDTEVANELGIQSVEFTYSGLWDTVSAGNEEAIRTLHGSTSAKLCDAANPLVTSIQPFPSAASWMEIALRREV